MIFWISNLYNYKTLKLNESLSPAATEWQTQFIQALKKYSNHKVHIINYNYSKYWPIGKIYIKKNIFNLKNIKSHSFDYINLPFFKDMNIQKQIIKRFDILKTKYKKIIFTYNFDKNIISSARELKKNNHIKWIAIVADFDEKDKKKIEQKIEEADLAIYLSNYAFKNSNLKKKILIQGGIDQIEKCKLKKIKTFLYSGSLGPWIDIEKFITDFLKFKKEKIKFFITSNDKKYFNQNLNIDNEKIQFLGFKNKRDLNKLSKKIDIFVNLRNEYNFDNNNNFPSKILHYLKYCKPIISTDQLSYRDELRNLLLIKKRNRSYVELIRKIIKFDNKFLTKKQKQSEKVIREFYNWNKIIKNLLTKISD